MVKTVFTIIVAALLGVIIITPLGPAHVVSDSMEPEIEADSAVFLTFPPPEVSEGDIVVFHPVQLDREKVIHRVVEETPEGFVTKGDATERTDQERGEPPVKTDQIIGQPLIAGGSVLEVDYELFVYSSVGAVALLGVFWAASDLQSRKKRLRVKHMQLTVLVFCLAAVAFFAGYGSGAREVSFLASQNPGDRPDHVMVGEKGEMEFQGVNRSVLPVLSFTETPHESIEQMAAPRSEFELFLEAPAREETGWHQMVVREYSYPLIMPPGAITSLHQVSPHLAMAGVSAPVLLVVCLLLRLLEPWMPLSMLGGKAAKKSWRRLMKKLS